MRRALMLICAAYLVLAGVYSVVTPILDASDELWHYPMVKFIADNNFALPVQDPTVTTAWRQEGSQPPLYYLLAALITRGIDTSDLDYIRRINPHADIGTIPPDGNINMIVHRSDAEAFPYRGTVLAVHVARLFSVILGLGTVIVTYCLALQLFPERPAAILGATAINAFLPMFLFISGSVNNDNLSNLLGNLLTLLIVLLLKRERAPTLRDQVVIGVVAGLGLLAKLNIGFLLPLVALAYLVVSIRRRDPRPLLVGGLVSGALTIAIAGWWYVRNMQLYGDPTGLNIFLDIVGRRSAPLAQLWAERESFTRGFWGFFGGMNVPMPAMLYLILNIVGALALLSALVFLLKTLLRREWHSARWLPALVTLAWIAISFVSYLRWTTETQASQGRLIFGALSSICVWFAVGLTWWTPKRLRAFIVGGAGGGLAVVAAVVPFTVIAPAYQTDFTLHAIGGVNPSVNAPDGGSINPSALVVQTDTVQPGNYVNILASWRIEERFSRDWSFFVHLVSADDVIVAQRDIYPGNGSLALSDLAVDTFWTDEIAIKVPDNAYAPQTLSVEIGWYFLPTGERFSVFEQEPSQRWFMGTVQLESPPNDLGVPNPLSINFGDEIELVGYEMTDLSPNAGEATDITLYWRGLRALTRDYVVFVHIIDPATLTIHAGSDAQPAAWTRPTTAWTPDEIVADTHTLNVNPDAPPSIYEVEIGLYVQTDAGFERLRVVTPDGGVANDYAYLNRVRVMPAAGEAP
ncbi:MAG: glycosyltransferase family 39 protein [Chloroflexota bacterium]|nr:glycosyltransferase family 39 protein [Chloroflexota bacterium]